MSAKLDLSDQIRGKVARDFVLKLGVYETQHPEWAKTGVEERLLAAVVSWVSGYNWLTTLRVLRGQQGSHSKEMEAKVLQAAADLGIGFKNDGVVRRPVWV